MKRVLLVLTALILLVVTLSAAQEPNGEGGENPESTEFPSEVEDLLAVLLAVGALGTAAFGIVEGLKWTPVGVLGFGQIRRVLGLAVMQCLEEAYGRPNLKLYLQALYREGRRDGELPRTIRQGTRIGLNGATAGKLASEFGDVVEGEKLKQIGESLEGGQELSGEERRMLGRFELALDTRIDAALARANTAYVGGVRVLASMVSVLIALGAWKLLHTAGMCDIKLQHAVLVGVAAVPVAPIAKDLAGALKSATVAIQRRS